MATAVVLAATATDDPQNQPPHETAKTIHITVGLPIRAGSIVAPTSPGVHAADLYFPSDGVFDRARKAATGAVERSLRTPGR